MTTTVVKRYLVYRESLNLYYIATWLKTDIAMYPHQQQSKFSKSIEGAWDNFRKGILTKNPIPFGMPKSSYDITNADSLEDVYKLTLVSKLVR